MSDFNLFIYKIFSSSDLIQFHFYLIFKKKKKVIYTYRILRQFYLQKKFGQFLLNK